MGFVEACWREGWCGGVGGLVDMLGTGLGDGRECCFLSIREGRVREGKEYGVYLVKR